MEFNIEDRVREKKTGESGVITDKMFSEARDCYIYIIKPDDGGRSFMRGGEDIEPFCKQREFKIEADIADNVVIIVIYEVEDDLKTEVCRGHGHIIHEGAEGIAQACAYASKQALAKIDSGIYFKQRRETR
jgi:hypothetical protein